VGLPKDEFIDSGHWPPQLYVREGRRMLGEYMMRQADMQIDRTKTDFIGNSHLCLSVHSI
jgi:hypothetical protein